MKNIIAILFAAVLFIACQSGEQRPSAKYEEKKATLEEMERDSPLKFLKVNASHRGNLLNQTVVEGEITNKATLVSYKNIQVQISFLDKDNSLIEKQKEILEVVIKPGETTDFKIKTNHVKGANSVTLDLVTATADKKRLQANKHTGHRGRLQQQTKKEQQCPR